MSVTKSALANCAANAARLAKSAPPNCMAMALAIALTLAVRSPCEPSLLW